MDDEYNKMLKLVDEVYRNDLGQTISDPMERLKFYVKQTNSEPEWQLIAIRVRAERAARKFLRQNPTLSP